MSFTLEMARSALHRMNEVIAKERGYLTDLDSAIGDADHGTNMDRGMTRVIEKIDGKEYTELGAIFRDTAMTLMSAVGGSAGPLYGTFFMKMGQSLAGKGEATVLEMADAIDAGLAGVMAIGKSQPGDKTMIDAIAPAAAALRENASSDTEAWAKAAEAAREGMEATIPMLARRGRSSYLGERSIGHQDPGATSSFYMIGSFRDAAEGA